MSNEWTSTKGAGNVWNPTKDESGNPRTEASENDFLDGYFVNQRDGVGQNNATVFTIQKKDGEQVDVWGTTMLAQEMSKVRRNQFIRIKWDGKKPTKAGALKPENKRGTKDSFHSWEVFISNTVPPLSGGSFTDEPAQQVQSGSAANISVEDDLPF